MIIVLPYLASIAGVWCDTAVTSAWERTRKHTWKEGVWVRLRYKHPLNTPSQCNAPSQYTLSIYPLNIPSQCNAPAQYALSMHPRINSLNTPSNTPFNTPTTITPTTNKPSNPPSNSPHLSNHTLPRIVNQLLQHPNNQPRPRPRPRVLPAIVHCGMDVMDGWGEGEVVEVEDVLVPLSTTMTG